MITIDFNLTPNALAQNICKLWEFSASRIERIEKTWSASDGAPVFTVNGQYTARGWTEWTQGFQYGSALLQYDATNDSVFLAIGRNGTIKRMARHITHTGVHDHGFNIVSTYGNLRRLMLENRMPINKSELDFYELALKCSGAVQAGRWTTIRHEEDDVNNREPGFIYSFNGPHSLFADTIRSLRSLAMAHQLGHELLAERDVRVSLLTRLIGHACATARYSVYYGTGRDTYDVRGRVAHESIFNTNDGSYRCPSTQQGYSPFTTWTRALAWIMLGFAEELEFISSLDSSEFIDDCGKQTALETMLNACQATCDYYIESTPVDGVPYWDTGAPGLVKMSGYADRPADPFNDFEPVDSSAAAIAAQGLMRLGHYLSSQNDGDGSRYTQAGLTVARTIFAPPYLCERADHQGLVLHSVYHRPNGWDHVPIGFGVPNGESSMWGDYHARELALYIQRLANQEPYLAFFQA